MRGKNEIDLENLKHPVAKSVNIAKDFPGFPEITNITYDLWYLQITIWFGNQKPPIYVRFDDVRGFRVLDEGDLCEFWSDCRPSGWLWEIEKGGWFDLESIRPGFLSGAQSKGLIKEYLITGINDCISVITGAEPEIFKPEY